MFGNLAQLMNLLKNPGDCMETVRQMNERLQAARFTGAAGGGQVQATTDGRGELVSIHIDPALVQTGDVELLEDLTSAAVRDAVSQSRTALQKEFGALTGGLSLLGLGDVFGGAAP
jgi:DNA-binding YbaB/EbfC family protein